MEDLTIRIADQFDHIPCALCGEAVPSRGSPGLFLGDSDEPVCLGCGKKRAPHLVSLLDLALVAERVGRTCKHLLVPPMEILLDLARAAENYSTARPRMAQRV